MCRLHAVKYYVTYPFPWLIHTCSALYYAQFDAQEKTCTLFCTKLWPDYYITQVFIKTTLKSFLLC